MVAVWRFFGLALVLAFALGAASAGADDKVYERKGREGRKIYTNIDNVSVDDRPLDEVPLPALARMDFTRVPAAELSKVDRRVEQAHQAVQEGGQCGGIRAASRVPLRSWLWQDHQRELITAAALFVFSLIVGFAWRGAVMRTLMPIAPFAGSVFLLYVATARAQEGMDDLHKGLRACSAELPEARPTEAVVVQDRLNLALEFKQSIEQVFAQRQRMIERSINVQ
jgi:hypothetical protein